MSTKKFRAYCFTVNNWTESDFNCLAAMEKTYLIMGKEIAPTTGTPHLQCYVYFPFQKTVSAAIKYLHEVCPRVANVEKANGDSLHNYTYCSKEGEYTEYGTRPLSQREKGAKGAEKIAQQWQAVKEGRFEDLPFALLKQAQYAQRATRPRPPTRDVLDNIWIQGPSGCGKSRWVRENYPEAYDKMWNKWWDGYDDEDVVHCEDMSSRHAEMLVDYFKRWMDHYPFKAEIKGCSIFIRPKTMIVTSQYTMDTVFAALPSEDLAALKRRFIVKDMGLPSPAPLAPMFNPLKELSKLSDE